VSKIYDALRRAEKDLSRQKRRRKRNPIRKTRKIKREHLFLKGIDDDFRRALLNLKNSIDSELKQAASRVIMFSSAVKGEGKTTIVASLGRILAVGEADRILLVDCSVNNPELHTLFGLENEKGILEFLAGETELPEVTQCLEEGVLYLITSGKHRDEDISQPLFSSDRMEYFIREAAENYDYVLIDSSSILEAPETSIIASLVNGVVMIIHAGRTKREVIKRAMLTVEKLDGRFIGTVLNRKRYYIPEAIYKRV
jgi:capsular exopolysaccharide synthesis family protein